jgi:2-amino-4-hydroxy-6-hydroxymethyldihydropteridine diphosphokinase
MSACGVSLTAASSLYRTCPVGQGRQPDYLNGVLAVETSDSPGRLLRCLKRLERCAGRRLGRRNGPRPLDLDILDFGGRVLNWRPTRLARRPTIVLPHPELHRRLFVLVPLAEVAPGWRHPVLGATAKQLAVRLRGAPRHGAGAAVRRSLDSSWVS